MANALLPLCLSLSLSLFSFSLSRSLSLSFFIYFAELRHQLEIDDKLKEFVRFDLLILYTDRYTVLPWPDKWAPLNWAPLNSAPTTERRLNSAPPQLSATSTRRRYNWAPTSTQRRFFDVVLCSTQRPVNESTERWFNSAPVKKEMKN